MTVPLTAIIWDYDGTLVDTREKNFRVARRIISQVCGDPPERFPALRSLEAYGRALHRTANWRELYRREFGLSEDETDRAGSLWTGYQLEDETPAALFEGIREALVALDGVPHGIVSQNARETIAQALAHADIAEYFRHIVGYEEVDVRRQKPEPDGLLACVEALTGLASGWVLYVGDHDTDVRCARHANEALAAAGRAVRIGAVGVRFGVTAAPAWAVAPDHVAKHPKEVVAFARAFLPDG